MNLIIKWKCLRESLLGLPLRKAVHPLLLKIMRRMRNYALVPVGNTLESEKVMAACLKAGPVIFAVNHSNMHDVPTAGEIIKEHCYLLASDEVRGSFNGLLFELMGVVWTKRNPDGKTRAELPPKEHMLKLLREGISLKTFPERTWNVSENEIIHPFKWGDVQLSQMTGCPIIPIIMDYDYTAGACYYHVGCPIRVDIDEDIALANERLRDTMASLRFELWLEKEEIRKSVPGFMKGGAYRCESRKEWDAYKVKLKEEYPGFDEDTEKKQVYRRTTSPEEAFAHLNDLIPSRENAFLLRKR